MHVCFILSEHSKSSFVSVINVQTSAICFPLNVLWLSLFFVWLQPSSFQALGHEILFFLITSLSQSFHNQTLATYFLEGKLISFVFSYLSYWSRVPGEGISHIIEVVFFFPTHRLKQKTSSAQSPDSLVFEIWNSLLRASNFSASHSSSLFIVAHSPLDISPYKFSE